MKLSSSLWIYSTLARCKMYRFKAKKGVKVKMPSDHALEHFDFFYAPVYKNRWPAIRLGLLSRQKLCALLNNYSADQQKSIDNLRNLGALDLKELLEEADSSISTTSSDDWSNSEGHVTSKDHVITKIANQRSVDFALKRQIRRKTNENQENNEPKTNFRPAVGSGDFENQNSDYSMPPEEDHSNSRSADSLHSFVPATRRIIRTDDDIEECDITQQERNFGPVNVKIVPDDEIPYPSALQVFLFPRGDVTTFPFSTRGAGNVSNYYLLDASTIFSVIALNLKLNDYVLDICSNPGGTSLTMLQTLLPGGLVCNDVRYSLRAKNILNEFLPSSAEIRDRIALKQKDPSSFDREWDEIEKYDKVVVNVPCTADRQSLIDNDEINLFVPSLNAQKLQLPDRQSAVLKAGLKSLKPGGTLIYTTTSLSPIQNDNVVENALRQYEIERKGRLNVVIRDLSPLAERFCRAGVFKFFPFCRYGELILPSLPSNFGPMYICKFTKI